MTTGVTRAFLRDLPSVIAKLSGGAFPEVRAVMDPFFVCAYNIYI